MECSLNARLLFIGTWSFADDYGNLERSSKQLKARIFPADNLDCEPLVLELIANGLLIEYPADGKKYLHIRGFRKHQVINRPGKPQCPLYEETVNTPRVVTDNSVSAHGTLPTGREGNGEEGSSSAHAKEAIPASNLHRIIALDLMDRGKGSLNSWERNFLTDVYGASTLSPKMQRTLDSISAKIGIDLNAVMITWAQRLETARKMSQWDPKWGPMPGKLGCFAPDTLVIPGDGQGWTEWKAAS